MLSSAKLIGIPYISLIQVINEKKMKSIVSRIEPYYT